MWMCWGGGVPVWLVSTLPTSFESRSRLRRKQMQCTDPSASHEVLASNHSQLAPSGFSPEGVPAFLWVSDAFARAARQALQACANPTSWGLTGLGRLHAVEGLSEPTSPSSPGLELTPGPQNQWLMDAKFEADKEL
ncbi:unnamed protein product [Effrenium voratum]|nr:unnamed protein product [Effrenium voratum]